MGKAKELGEVIWFSLISLVFIALISFGLFGINRVLYPAWTAVQRETVEQSKSFIDSSNSTLLKLKKEHSKLDSKIAETDDKSSIKAYKSQQIQIVEQMCGIVDSMDQQTVNQNIKIFISEEGGC